MYSGQRRCKMKIFTVEDISKKTNKSVKTISRQIAEGNLKATKVNNRSRIAKEDYEEFTDTICANKEYWIDCCSEYNDGISEW